MALSSAAKAGALLFVGVVQFGIMVIMAEAVSPSYSVASNYISDLGYVFPASARIFNPSIVVMGLFVVAAGYFLQRAYGSKLRTSVVVLAGLSCVGVGVFNEGSPYSLHIIFSTLTFLFIGLTAILAAKWQKAPLSYFSMFMGAVTLVTMVLYSSDSGMTLGNALGIGVGGAERLIVYPTLFWAVAFSGHLMGSGDPTPK